MITFLLALVPFLAQGDPPQPTVPEVACYGCEGVGTVTGDCAECEGKGKGNCFECLPESATEKMRRLVSLQMLTEPDKAKEYKESLEKIEELEESFKESPFLRVGKTWPGRVECPARCHDGKSFLNRGHPCKPCDAKGTIPCTQCRSKAVGPCHSCGGRKKVKQACSECFGARMTRDILGRSEAGLATCPWCADTRLLACHACDDEGKSEQVCSLCAGTRTRHCKDCKGGQKAKCNKCSSTGDLSSYFASKASNNCDQCKKKGFLPCTTCKRGITDCEPCEGTGAGNFPCRFCLSQKKGICRGCNEGRGRAWLLTGERLLEAGHTDIGLLHMQHGLKREEDRAAAVLLDYQGTSKDRYALKRTQDKALSKLRKRIQKTEKDAKKKSK